MVRGAHLIATVLAILTGGCAPWVERIYRPEAPNGRLLETYCGYESGPGRWDRIELNEHGLSLRVRAARIDNGIAFEVRFLIPEGITARLASTTFTISPVGNASSVDVRVEEIRYSLPGVFYQWQSMPVDARMDGKSVQASRGKSKGTYRQIYSMSFAIQGFDGNPSFILRLPLIEVNGKSRKFSEVRFAPATETYIAGYCAGVGEIIQNFFPNPT